MIMKMWVARNRSGDLQLFEFRPYEYNGMWFEGNDEELEGLFLWPTRFPEVTFENSPMEVELKLIEK